MGSNGTREGNKAMTIELLTKDLINVINKLEAHIKELEKYNTIRAYCELTVCNIELSVYKDILRKINI